MNMKSAIVLLICLGLTACGGSSGSSTPPAKDIPINKPPVIVLQNAKTVESGEGITFEPVVTDAEGDVTTYLWQVKDAGINVENAKARSSKITFPDVDTDTTFSISFTATDSKGNKTTKDVDVLVKAKVAINKAPVIVFKNSHNVESGTQMLFEPAVTDPEGDVIAYFWQANDAAVSFDNVRSKTPTVIFPAVDNDKTFEINFSATDSKGNKSLKEITVLVQAPIQINKSPVITLPMQQDVISEQTIIFTAKVTDPENDSLTIAWSSSNNDVVFNDKKVLAPSVTFPEALAKLSIIITLNVTDSVGNSTVHAIDISLMPAPVENPPLISILSTPSGTSGDAITLKASVITSNTITKIVWGFDGKAIQTFSSDKVSDNSYLVTLDRVLPEVDVFTQLPVLLTVTTDNSLTALKSANVFVSPNVTPALEVTLPSNIELTEKQIKMLTPVVTHSHVIDSYLWRWKTPTNISLVNATTKSPTLTAPMVDSDKTATLELVVTMGDVIKTIETVVSIKDAPKPSAISLSLSRTIAVEGNTVEVNVLTDKPNEILSATWIFQGMDNVVAIKGKTNLVFTVPKILKTTTVSIIYTALLTDGTSVIKAVNVSALDEGSVRRLIVIKAPGTAISVFNNIPAMMPILLVDQLNLIDSIEVTQPFTVNTFKPIGISRTSQFVNLTLETDTIVVDHTDFMNLQIKVGALVIDFPFSLQMRTFN